MALVKKIISKEIEDSPLTKPKKQEEDGTEEYTHVLFLDTTDSALIMGVTVYYDSCNPTEYVKDDINTRVRDALIANNIEIPHQYITVSEVKKRI